QCLVGLVVPQQLEIAYPDLLCCQTTSPIRHCKIDSYKHDSERQRHDGTCSFTTAGGPPV
ncbi:unnamed protein product, partial [Staurois parvus]